MIKLKKNFDIEARKKNKKQKDRIEKHYIYKIELNS